VPTGALHPAINAYSEALYCVIQHDESSQLHDHQEVAMINKAELCKKITEIYPDIGQCGIDLEDKNEPV
jgi:hypothetical protein